MKHIFALLLFCFVLASCSSKKEEAETEKKLKFDLEERIRPDSAYGYKIGDVFLSDSLYSYGFILVEIEEEPQTLAFMPVKLAKADNDLDKILGGTIRMVPTNPDNPESGDYGVECLGVMSLKQIQELGKNLKFIFRLKLKDPLPKISSVVYGTLSAGALVSFIRQYEHSWEGQSKLVKAKDIIE